MSPMQKDVNIAKIRRDMFSKNVAESNRISDIGEIYDTHEGECHRTRCDFGNVCVVGSRQNTAGL